MNAGRIDRHPLIWPRFAQPPSPSWASVRTHLICLAVKRGRRGYGDGEAEALCDGVESAQTADEGDGAGRTLFCVAVPAAEAGDAPGRPGEAASGVRVLLFLGLAFQLAGQRLHDGDFSGLEDARGRKGRAGLVPAVDELHDARGGDERGRRQAFEGVAVA